MVPPRRRFRRSPRTPLGISMLEVTLSIAIVGGLLASVFSAASGSAMRGFSTTQRSKAAWLAHDLLAEIGAKPCAAGVDNLLTLTPLDLGDVENIKSAVEGSSRAGFDSVYDYANWSSTPPVDASGNAMTGFDGWTRLVTVSPVDPETLTRRTANDGAALITVVAVGPRGQRRSVSMVRSAETDTLRDPNSDSEDGISIVIGDAIDIGIGGK